MFLFAICSLQLGVGAVPMPAAGEGAGSPAEASNATVSGALTGDTPVADVARDDFLREQSTLLFTRGGFGQASLVLSGLGFLVFRSPFARAVELQMVAWGAVTAVLAAHGLLAEKKLQSSKASADHWQAERRTARRLYWINAWLDAAYLVVGALLWRQGRRGFLRGSGAGLAMQGGVLLLIDAVSGLLLG